MNNSFLKSSGFAKREDRKFFRYWPASMEGCVAPRALTVVHTRTYSTNSSTYTHLQRLKLYLRAPTALRALHTHLQHLQLYIRAPTAFTTYIHMTAALTAVHTNTYNTYSCTYTHLQHIQLYIRAPTALRAVHTHTYRTYSHTYTPTALTAGHTHNYSNYICTYTHLQHLQLYIHVPTRLN